VQVPEDVDQRFVLHFFPIEFDLHHFGVSGLVGANIFVSWIFGVAVAVAYQRVNNARNLAELYFNSPEKQRPANVANSVMAIGSFPFGSLIISAGLVSGIRCVGRGKVSEREASRVQRPETPRAGTLSVFEFAGLWHPASGFGRLLFVD